MGKNSNFLKFSRMRGGRNETSFNCFNADKVFYINNLNIGNVLYNNSRELMKT